MFTPSISRRRVCPNTERACPSPLQLRKSSRVGRFAASTLQPRAGFTLLELLIVVGIIALLMVLIAPAFTTIKSGTDVTSSAYTIKGVLDTARTYAKANNTYVWVGFYEEDVSQPSTNPPTPGNGRLIMSIVASKDGTNVATTNPIDRTKLIQVGKLTKIDNVHLATFPDATATPPPTSFDTRPPVTFGGTQYTLAGLPDSTTPFQYPLAGTPQYSFVKAVQLSPRGEARINNTALQRAAEIGLRQTHGTTVDTNSPNVVAVQFNGFAGDVKIYRR